MVERLTRTGRYLYPAFGSLCNTELWGMLAQWHKLNIVGGKFLGDEQGTTENGIYLFTKTPIHLDLVLKKFQEAGLLIDAYEIPDKHVMFILNLTDKFSRAYHFFKESQYSRMYSSKFLEDTKNTIFKAADGYGKNYHVLAHTEIGRQGVMKEFGIEEPFDAQQYDGIWNPTTELFNKGQFGL